jgi:hypothetical protein
VFRPALLLLLPLTPGVAACAEPCPVTTPDTSPVAGKGASWYGSTALAARIPTNGHWEGMGAERQYGDKFWWWREGFDAREEPRPALTISAARLDGRGSVQIDSATAGFGEDWHAMLVGMEFPVGGCWRVVGRYRDQELRMVLWVGDAAPPPAATVDAGKTESPRCDPEPVPLTTAEPRHPRHAFCERTRGLAKWVDVSVTIGTAGVPADPVIVASSSSIFERAAADAVLRYRYAERAVPCATVERVTFCIDQPAPDD